jgi:hypothetical protein
MFAAFMQGKLPISHAARLEEHIDRCADCTALMATLGQLYGPEGSIRPGPPAEIAETAASPSSAVRPAISERVVQTNVALQIAMWMIHVWGTVLALPIFWASIAEPVSAGSPLVRIAVLYAGFWLCTGLVWTLVNAYGLFHHKRWARSLTLAYALLSLPSCFGTPYSAYALYSLLRPGMADLFGAGRPLSRATG